MAKLKVIEYVPTLDDGGAETLVKDYVTLIDKEKFDVKVVVARNTGWTANTKRILANKTHIISIYPRWNFLTRAWNKCFGRLYVSYRLKRIITQEKPDVVHVHLALLEGIYAVRNHLQGIKLFYTCHSLPKRYFCGANAQEGDAARHLIQNNGLRIIALHDEMHKEINDMFGIHDTVVIRNGIDFKHFREINISKIEKRIQLGVPENAFVIGHVGRFIPSKNHLFLVDVFRSVVLKKENAFLLMIGAGDASEVKRQLAEYGLDNKYLILSHREDINEIMRAMDVFVFPSIYEGLGIALIEAQVSGLRCVVSDKIPVEAIKTREVVSLPLGDPELWADVILDEQYKGTMIGNLDDYDMNKEIKRLEKLYSGEYYV